MLITNDIIFTGFHHLDYSYDGYDSAVLKRGKIWQYKRQDLENAVKAVEAGESIRQALD